MISKLFWKSIYRLRLGDAYDDTVKKAKLTMLATKASTKGDVSSFHNVDGQQIRGWHRPMNYSLKYSEKHPLISRYGNR